MTASAALDECGIYEPAPAAFAGRQLSADQPMTGIDRSLYMASPLPLWLATVRAQIEDLGQLPAGWNTYGALPIKPSSRAFAIDLLRQVSTWKTPKPAIVPTSDGSIQIEWHTANIDLEVRLLSSTRIGVFFEDGQGQIDPIDDEFQYDFRPLARAINALSTR